MRTQLVLTLIGPDRPGLVEALSDAVAAHGGNWEESRMAHLAGKFAGILRVSVSQESAGALTTALSELQEEGLRLVIESSKAASPPEHAQRLTIDVVGNDREGIVRDISRALAKRGVNVEELSTSCEEAPMGGGQLFKATIHLQLPPTGAVEELRSALESLADDLMVDIAFDGKRRDPK